MVVLEGLEDCDEGVACYYSALHGIVVLLGQVPIPTMSSYRRFYLRLYANKNQTCFRETSQCVS